MTRSSSIQRIRPSTTMRSSSTGRKRARRRLVELRRARPERAATSRFPSRTSPGRIFETSTTSSCMRSASWSKARSATIAHHRRASRSLSVISAARSVIRGVSLASRPASTYRGTRARAALARELAFRKRRRGVRRSRYVTQVKRRRGCRRSGSRSSSSSTSCRTCTTRRSRSRRRFRSSPRKPRTAELTRAFTAHQKETEKHVVNLEKVFEHLGGAPRRTVPRNRRHQEGHDDFMKENDPSPQMRDAFSRARLRGRALRDRGLHRPRQPGSGARRA